MVGWLVLNLVSLCWVILYRIQLNSYGLSLCTLYKNKFFKHLKKRYTSWCQTHLFDKKYWTQLGTITAINSGPGNNYNDWVNPHSLKLQVLIKPRVCSFECIMHGTLFCMAGYNSLQKRYLHILGTVNRVVYFVGWQPRLKIRPTGTEPFHTFSK